MSLIAPVPHNIFTAARVKANKSASQTHVKSKQGQVKVREIKKVEVLGGQIQGKTEKLVKNSANFRELNPFMQELAGILVDVDQVKKSLYGVQWSGQKINELSNQYRGKMRQTRGLKNITKLRKKFEARTESIMKKVEKEFDFLDNARNKLKKMPSIKEMPTIILAGYPNVGKSSLLNALSNSKVDVQAYPFTTKNLLVGYGKERYFEFQIVDTPGLLDREKWGVIEQKAISAMKHLSKKIVFVFDPTQDFEKQNNLLKKLKKLIDGEVMIVVNKKDLVEKNPLKGEFISAQDKKDITKLKKKIVSWLRD